MDLLEAAPVLICCSELGGSAFRGTDLLALAGNQLVPYRLSIVERLSLFQRFLLGRFHCSCVCKPIFRCINPKICLSISTIFGLFCLINTERCSQIDISKTWPRPD